MPSAPAAARLSLNTATVRDWWRRDPDEVLRVCTERHRAAT